jgi:hypothetical protein
LTRPDDALSTEQSIGPPRLPLVISVGVTGHRAHSFEPTDLAALPRRLDAVFAELEVAALKLFARSEVFFSDGPVVFRLVSPLADGSDQAAAEAAIARGWELQAILPFDRDTYRSSIDEGSRPHFDRLLGQAGTVLELPGRDETLVEAYVMTGRGTIAHSDILLAVWDGKPPRGPGGTGDVAVQAIASGTAVIHVAQDSAAAPRLIWSGFDPTVVTMADGRNVTRPFELDQLDIVLGATLLPPADMQERDFYRRFAAERLRRIRTRIEYPLLLSIFGVRRISARDIAEHLSAREIDEEWRAFHTGCAKAHDISVPIDLLQAAYSWADRLATHFAQTYRSGHIFSFVLGGAAVCLGLSGFIAPGFNLQFAIGEMLITFAIILNALVGTRNEWHRRWLDYRQLAERLRPMRSLKMLGIAMPDPPGTRTNPVPRRWIDWYAATVWRAIGAPSGDIDRTCAANLAKAIADHEVDPQMRYHRKNAHTIDRLDHRLEFIGTALFAATLLVSASNIVGLAVGARWVNDLSNWFNLVESGFPALGTAIFGIRFQADFGGDAIRSMATARTLSEIDSELRRDVDLDRAADLTEQAARVMLADLDEWRLVNQQRELEMG